MRRYLKGAARINKAGRLLNLQSEYSRKDLVVDEVLLVGIAGSDRVLAPIDPLWVQIPTPKRAASAVPSHNWQALFAHLLVRRDISSFQRTKQQRPRSEDVIVFMVGIAGFEPTSDGVKVRCLTAWLYPSMTPPCLR